MPSWKNWIFSHNVDSEHQWRGCLDQTHQTTIQSTISAVRSIDRTLENSTMIDERALISALFRDRDHIILDQKRFVLSYQRDEILYADHSSTEADQLLWNTLTIQLCSARFTDDFKSVESLLITVMSVFKTINILKLVISESSDQSISLTLKGHILTAESISISALINKLFTITVLTCVMTEPQQDTNIISAAEVHISTATSSATVTKAHFMLELSN